MAFKSAAVDACSHVSEITKVEARGAFHIDGELLKIEGTPTMREDMVRIGMGTADLRYRGEFKQWKTTFKIRYNKNVLSIEQIMLLFNTAGFAIGGRVASRKERFTRNVSRRMKTNKVINELKRIAAKYGGCFNQKRLLLKRVLAVLRCTIVLQWDNRIAGASVSS